MIDFANASYLKLRSVSNDTYESSISPFLVPGEKILATFQSIRDGLVFTSLRLLLGPFPPRNQRALDMWMDTSIRLDRQPWHYLVWIPRYLELFREVRRTRRELMPRLRTPALCFQSRRDELVSLRSCRDLEKHPCIHLQVLEHSGHFQYGPADLVLLQQAFCRQLRQLQALHKD